MIVQTSVYSGGVEDQFTSIQVAASEVLGIDVNNGM